MKPQIVRTILFAILLTGAGMTLPTANAREGHPPNWLGMDSQGIITQTVATQAGAMSAGAPQQRPITFRDLISMRRISDPQISPDGKWVAYSISTPDLEANHSVKDIWLVSTDGRGEPKQLTQNGGDTRPRWSSDGKQLAYLSVRDGVQQVYVLTMDSGQ
jgi:hypothetical protein